MDYNLIKHIYFSYVKDKTIIHLWYNYENKIKKNLTNDLRLKRYNRSNNKLAGHCYIASEVFYYLTGGKRNGWTPMFVKHENEPHWFLKHKLGFIVDITAEQFKTPVPYHKARGKGFLTKKPSKRAKMLIDKITK